MKKLFVFCITFLFFVCLANASVNVEIGEKTKKYPDGSTLKISSKKRTTIKYSNFNIVIPRGNHFILDCEKDKVTFRGKFDKPVKMNSYTLSTESGNCDFSISTEGNVTVNEGSVTIKDEQNNVAVASNDTQIKLDMPKEKYIDNNSNKSIFVTESEDISNEIKNTEYIQSVKDLELSPSAPRN